MRWLTGVFVVPALGAATVLLLPAVSSYPRLAGSAAVLIGTPLVLTRRGRWLVNLVVYSVVISAASLAGIIKGSLGRVSGVWVTTRQEAARAAETDRQ
jgi:hypothetical protein